MKKFLLGLVLLCGISFSTYAFPVTLSCGTEVNVYPYEDEDMSDVLDYIEFMESEYC